MSRRVVSRSLIAILFVVGVAGAACGKPAPQPPTVTPPGTSEPILGNERIGWDQRAGDNVELAALRYAIYVDGTRSELSGATCANTATETGFACSAPLPRMTIGNHGIELAAFVQDGAVLESGRSATLFVTVAAATPTAGDAPSTIRSTATAWPSTATQIAEGLGRPADLAVLPDGRVLVAEKSGRVRIVRADALASTPALVLQNDVKGGQAVLALAVDPEFARTRFVFAIYSSRSPSGAVTFTLARFREAADTLADRVVLLDDIRASADPHASLRFGPDRKLYAAFDDGGSAKLAADLASLNGKILRLNADGTTPDDQPRGSPVLSAGHASPRGIDWHVASKRMWAADIARVGTATWTSQPTSVVVRGDDLFVASETGLRRARIDRRNPDRIVEISDLLKGSVVDAVAVARDGTIYFASGGALGQIKTGS